jgi:hypothetical protein
MESEIELKYMHSDDCYEDYPCDDCNHLEALQSVHGDEEWFSYPEDYLNSVLWMETSKLVKKVYGNLCANIRCHSNTKLVVHHKCYRRWGYERLKDLVCVCQDCHELLPKGEPCP